MNNPYAKALLAIAVTLFSLSVLVWTVGYMNSSQFDVDTAEVGGLYSSAGWLFNAGFLSTLAWLLARSIGWRPDAADQTDAKPPRTLNLGGDIELR